MLLIWFLLLLLIGWTNPYKFYFIDIFQETTTGCFYQNNDIEENVSHEGDNDRGNQEFKIEIVEHNLDMNKDVITASPKYSYEAVQDWVDTITVPLSNAVIQNNFLTQSSSIVKETQPQSSKNSLENTSPHKTIESTDWNQFSN